MLTFICSVAAADACTLRVATSGDYAPFSLKTPAGGYEGLDIDIVRRLGADLGCAITFVPFKWPELNAQLQSGTLDLVASGVTVRPERALLGRFSRPYADTGALALLRAADGTRFANLDDLNKPDVRVAVNAGGHLERVARAQLPRAALRPQRDNRALPAILRDGRADAVITDSAEARAWMGDDLRAIGPFTRDYKALLLAARPDAEELIVRIDGWLRAREEDGWLAAQRARHLGEGAPDAARAQRNAVAALVRLRLELMPAVGAAKRKARLPIEDKTQERRVLVRVAAQQPRHPARLANAYRVLIAMAKAIQDAHASEKASAPLDALRDAITRIDQQLVREIDAPHPTSEQEWRTVIDPTITLKGIGDGMRAELARALSTDS